MSSRFRSFFVIFGISLWLSTGNLGAQTTTALTDELTFDTLWVAGRNGVFGKSAYCVGISPDGRYVAAGYECPRPKLRVWDVQSRTLVIDAELNGICTIALRFSPDGRYIAVGKEEGQVLIWDLTTRTQIREVFGFQDMILSVAFSPDGQYLAIAGADKRVRVFNFPAMTEAYSFEAHLQNLTWVEFSPSGRQLVTTSDDKTAKIWSFPGLVLQHTLTGHTAAVEFGPEWSPDGTRLLTTSADKTARWWDWAAETAVQTLNLTNELRTGAVSRHATLAYLGGKANNLVVWNLEQNTREAQLTAYPRGIYGLETLGDTLLVSAHEDGAVVFWKIGGLRKQTTARAPLTAAADTRFWVADGRVVRFGPELTATALEVRVIGSTGQVLMQVAKPAATDEVSLPDTLPSGVYLIQLVVPHVASFRRVALH